MEASLTCAVCLCLFEDPITLPVCSHNFCRHCVVECLSQAGSVAESASLSSGWLTSARSHDPLQESPWASGGASRDGGWTSLPCPLCRKLCSLPLDGGAAALPVNTTLAEVVKLFKAASPANHSSEATVEEPSSALDPQLTAVGGLCEKHPGRPLQLYCRMCRRGGCGQCVSEEHSGVFHSVNLIDTVYQEEKLAFFSNLKKIRDLQLKLIKEKVSPKDEKAPMQNEEELVKTEFDKLCNTLEARKKELLENLESQKRRKEKEHLIWNNVKEAHQKTVTNILIDCERLLAECDPQHFVELACNLNQRMKTQLELMQLASDHDDQPECKQMQLDTRSIIEDILALRLTEVNLDVLKADIPSGNSEPSISASPENKWEDKKTIQDTFCPVLGEDDLVNGRNIQTQYMSVSAAPKHRSMSHEELRYRHYMKDEVQSDKLQSEIINERNTLPKLGISKKGISGTGLFCIGAEANNEKKPKAQQLLQKQSANRCSLSDSLGFAFKTQTPDFNFCDSNSLNVLDNKDTQNNTKETNLLESTNRYLKTEKRLPTYAETCPKSEFSFSACPSVSQTAVQPRETLKPASAGAMEHLAPVLFSNSDANLTVSAASSFPPKKLELSTSFLENSISKVCNARNVSGNISSAFSATTVVPFDKTQYACDKLEVKSKTKAAIEKKSSPKKKVSVQQELKTLACHHALSPSMGTHLKSQNGSSLVHQQNLVCDSSASSTSVSIERNKDNSVLDSHRKSSTERRSDSVHNETNCTANSDP